MNLKLLPILLVSLCTNSVKAQNDILWEKRIEQQKSSYLYNAISTPDYGLLLLGSTLSSNIGFDNKENKGQLDFYLIKMDENGKIEWENSFGGNKNDKLYSAKQTNDGGFILVGSSNSDKSGDKSSENLGQNDIWLIKLDPKGKITWDKTIGGIGNDIPVKVIQTEKNEIVVGAYTNSPSLIKNPSSQKNDIYIVKFDSNGNLLWENTYGNDNDDKLIDIIQKEDQFILFSNNFSEKNSSNIQIFSINNEGDLLHKKILNDYSSYLHHIDNYDNQFILTVNEKKNNDIVNKILFYDNTFNLISSTTIDSKNTFDLKENYYHSNNIIISTSNQINTLENKKTTANPESYFMYETFDLSGKKITSLKLGNKGYNYLEKSIKTRDNSIILFGSSAEIKNNNQENSKLYLVKIGDNESQSKRDYIEVYPNPTNNFTNILINKDFDKATIEIYNISGQHLQSIDVKYRSTPISLGDYPSGVYIAKINYDNQTESIKIIKK